MRDEKKILVLDSWEQGLLVNSLNDMRNAQLRKNGPTEDVEDLLLKVIDAPPKRERRRISREAR